MALKRNLVGLTLWAAYLLTMAASISHLAWTFNTLEPPGNTWAGWASAVAVDAGLAALAYAIQQRRRARRPVRALWGGVIVLAAVSAYANTVHALAIAPGELVRALVLSAILPLLVVYLGEIISSDDAAAADAAEAAAVREARRIEREQARMDAERAAQAAEAERARAAQAAEPSAHVCAACEQSFRNQQALAAHTRFCAARLALVPVNGAHTNGVNGAH